MYGTRTATATVETSPDEKYSIRMRAHIHTLAFTNECEECQLNLMEQKSNLSVYHCYLNNWKNMNNYSFYSLITNNLIQLI